MEPQVRGVVIISLPPPGDPSKGKTITAFAIPDDPEDVLRTSGHHRQQQQRRRQRQSESPLPPAAESSAASRRSLTLKKAAWSILAISLLLAALWVSLFSEAPIEFLQSSEEVDRQRESGSLLLPLIPKRGTQRLLNQGEVKLGSAGGHGRGREMEASPVANSSAVFPVRGNIFPDGLYYTSIRVGNPPREYFLDVDTGSDLTWIQCDAPCQSCAKGPNPLYKPSRANIVLPRDLLCLEVQSSQNSRPCDSCGQCDYEIAYADHSSSMGVLARDELQLMMVNQKQALPSFVFGCAYDQQGQLLASPAKTDGILGLSGAKVSFPSQLSDQHVIMNVVGHCIKVKGGGYLFLGNDFVPRWGMTWVPMLNAGGSFYQMEVSRVNYGNQQVGAKNTKRIPHRVVLDTGSSYTYFTKELYSNLITLLEDIPHGLVRDESDDTLPVCWRANFPVRSLKDVRQFFDPITLNLGNKWWIIPRVFQIPPEGYLILNNKGNVCLGILNGTEVHDGSTNILGGRLCSWATSLLSRQRGFRSCSHPRDANGLDSAVKLPVFDSDKNQDIPIFIPIKSG